MTRDNLRELGTSFFGPDVEIEIDVEADATNGRTEERSRRPTVLDDLWVWHLPPFQICYS